MCPRGLGTSILNSLRPCADSGIGMRSFFLEFTFGLGWGFDSSARGIFRVIEVAVQRGLESVLRTFHSRARRKIESNDSRMLFEFIRPQRRVNTKTRRGKDSRGKEILA